MKQIPITLWFVAALCSVPFVVRGSFAQAQEGIAQSGLLEEVNQVRAQRGLPVLAESAQLNQAAASKLREMQRENYWGHIRPTDNSYVWPHIDASGYVYQEAAENLAQGYVNSEDVVQAWLESPQHRANIMNSRYEDVGFAVGKVLLAGRSETVVVQLFGRQ